jgi:hypothetical protein
MAKNQSLKLPSRMATFGADSPARQDKHLPKAQCQTGAIQTVPRESICLLKQNIIRYMLDISYQGLR